MKKEAESIEKKSEIRNQKAESRKQKAWGVEARGHLLVLRELHKWQEVAQIQHPSRCLACGGVIKKNSRR